MKAVIADVGGATKINRIKGQAFLVYWSYEPTKGKWWEFHKKVRWGRIGNIIQSQFDKSEI